MMDRLVLLGHIFSFIAANFRKWPSLLFSLQHSNLRDETIDDRRIREGRRIAELVNLVANDLAKDSAHNLARPGHGQARRNDDHIRRRKFSNFFADAVLQLLQQLIRFFLAAHQHDESCNRLALDVMRTTNNSGLCDIRVCHQRTFNFRRTDTVSRYVQHVINWVGQITEDSETKQCELS